MTTHYSPEARHEIVDALNGFLADTTVVYYKTHAFHWNVEGPSFYSVHLMFETFYKDLWESMDDVAERIRAFSEKVFPNLEMLLQHASIAELETAPSSDVMVQNLRDDYIALSKKALAIGITAEKHGDLVTSDLMTQRSAFLEKAAWMLQATVKSSS